MTDLNYDEFTPGDWIVHDAGYRQGRKGLGTMFVVGVIVGGVIAHVATALLIGGAL